MKYACTAATQKGARCRGWATNGSQLCPSCQRKAKVEIVGQPDAVEYKFNLNENWVRRLMALGVDVRDQNFQEKEQKHIEQAQQHGREAFRYRTDIADSGVPVFGSEGLVNVSVYELFRELVVAYEIVDVYIRPTRPGANERMRKLVVYFAHGDKKANIAAIETLLEFLASSCWGFCHVWANPPGFTGKIKDTVNISHREQDKQPERIVRFANGLWAVEEVAS